MAVANGRMKRLGFFLWLILAVVCAVIVAVVLQIYAGGNEAAELRNRLVAVLICNLLLFVPTVRRLHDMGHSGWFYHMLFVPFVSIIWLFILLFNPGEPTENKYGPA
jgi:uncharacterized membrane protein YhaH (DUF805 family)